MLRRIAALGFALAVVMVPMTTAQEKPGAPVNPAVQASPANHAIIGTIKHVDAQTNTIVVTQIGGTDQSYTFGSKTIVRGLPGITRVAALGSKLGENVVLHYATVGGKPEARAIEYLGAAEIQQFEGIMVKVDAKARTVTLKPATGASEEFVIATRAALDLKSGIVPLAQLKQLTNVRATVYYSVRGKEKLVLYLEETAAPRVSLR